MASPTLLDVLDSQQFRTVILLALGLEFTQIADFFETGEPAVFHSLRDGLERAGCLSEKSLVMRLLFEYENGLYDERLDTELEGLQGSAKRLLEPETEASTSALRASVEGSRLPSVRWLM